MTYVLLERLTEATSPAPLLGFAVGVARSLSPVSLPAMTVSLAALSPGRLDADGQRRHMLLRRSSLCKRASAIPPAPSGAFLFGVVFSVTGCPGCGPVVVGLTSVAVIVAGPGTALLVLGTFLLDGRSRWWPPRGWDRTCFPSPLSS